MENYIGFLGVYLLKVKEEIYYIQDLKLQMLVWYRRRELRLSVISQSSDILLTFPYNCLSLMAHCTECFSSCELYTLKC